MHSSNRRATLRGTPSMTRTLGWSSRTGMQSVHRTTPSPSRTRSRARACPPVAPPHGVTSPVARCARTVVLVRRAGTRSTPRVEVREAQQSIEPSVPTRAVVQRSPMMAYSSIGRAMGPFLPLSKRTGSARVHAPVPTGLVLVSALCLGRAPLVPPTRTRRPRRWSNGEHHPDHRPVGGGRAGRGVARPRRWRRSRRRCA